MCCFVPQMRETTKEPSQTTKDAAGDADAQVKGEDADAINVWKAGMLISLRDDDGDAFAHGSVIDGEPNPDIFDDNALVSAEHVEPGWWVHVKITSVVDPRIKLLPDCVFSHDGQELPNNESDAGVRGRHRHLARIRRGQEDGEEEAKAEFLVPGREGEVQALDAEQG